MRKKEKRTFFFQAEYGIRGGAVTGVQTCAPSRRGHTRCSRDWSSDVCSSDHKIHKRVNIIPLTQKDEKGTVLMGED